MDPQELLDKVDIDVELIGSSLMPTETFTSSAKNQWPRTLVVRSRESRLSLSVSISAKYPRKDAVTIQIKGDDTGRDEAEGWKEWVEERMNRDWDVNADYPLYQIMTTHFLPLLAPSSPSPPPLPFDQQPIMVDPKTQDTRLHHALLTSHHLLAPSKRKDLISLSSQLSLVGFAKTGHPGIMYALGLKDDVEEWIKEVKSWQWLALRVRIGVEPSEEPLHGGGGRRGAEDGARGGKGRGEWMEVEKISEALEWLKERGRERVLLDIGMGSG